ncbi:LysE family transporter [Psychrobacillus sp.]|uniref:LysE family translocator n=1 Tax=Psychrobacillus sp. TaxID=1871623 RepID=UPI0028BE1217|nr:LysE family transporter [Psychrobacillus sp.]
MIWRGFRFGMLLQIAVGPICVFIFQTAAASGFWAAEIGVVGVVIIDALFILAAIFGIGALLNTYKKAKEMMLYFGAGVLIVFGLSNVVGFFGVTLMPSLDFLSEQSMESVFWKTLILTLSNPLTIIFWAGVFSTKIVEEKIGQLDIYFFGLGALLSTFLFLTTISILGSFLTVFLAPVVLKVLNLLVGLVLMGFGIKALAKSNILSFLSFSKPS